MWSHELFVWVLAIYQALYGLIAQGIRAIIKRFMAPEPAMELPISSKSTSFIPGCVPADGIPIPWVLFDRAILRAHSQKSRRSTRYGTYPPENDALSEIGSSAASPSLSTTLTLFSSSETFPSVSTSPTLTISSITEVESEDDFPNLKGEVMTVSEEVASDNRLSLVIYKPVFESTAVEAKGISVPDVLTDDVLNDDEDDNLSMVLYKPIVDALVQHGSDTVADLDPKTCNFDLPSLANALGLCLQDANIFLHESSFISPNISGLHTLVRSPVFIEEDKLSQSDLSVVTPAPFSIANCGPVAVQTNSVLKIPTGFGSVSDSAVDIDNETAIFATVEFPKPSFSIEDSSPFPKDDILELSFAVVMAKIAEMQAWDWDDPPFLPTVFFDEKENSNAENHILNLSEQTGYYDVLDLFEESDDSIIESAIPSPSRDHTMVSPACTPERRRILSLHSTIPGTGQYSRLRPLVLPRIVALCHSTSGDCLSHDISRPMFRKSF